MEIRTLGRTGLQVSALCLGTMNFGDDCAEADSIALVHRALDDGINFVDTADVYNAGVSEEIVGKALSGGGRRDRVVLATKAHNRTGDGPNDFGNHRRHLVAACEASLRRLRTDWIDLYQIHRPQSSVPIDETLRALDDLVRAGKVRHVGTSTFAAWQIVESLWASKEYGLNRFVTEQPPYNLLDRRIERELLPMCRTYGIGTLPWAPLAGGLLTGKYVAGSDRPAGARYTARTAPFGRDHAGALEKVAEYVRFCAARGHDPSVFAQAWVLRQPGIVSPIIGPRTAAQYEASLRALDLVPSAEERAEIDALFPPGTHVSEYYRADFGPTARW